MVLQVSDSKTPSYSLNKRSLLWLLMTLLIMLTLFAANSQRHEIMSSSQLQALGYVELHDSVMLETVRLIDTNSAFIDAGMFQGQWSLVFFGFTFCPDICPTTLSVLNRVKQTMGSTSPQIIFVSVDPERDSAESLKNYTSAFNPAFKALTGSLEHITAFAYQLHTAFSRGPGTVDYSVDHSVNIALINPAGKYVGYFRIPHQSESIVKVLQALTQ